MYVVVLAIEFHKHQQRVYKVGHMGHDLLIGQSAHLLQCVILLDYFGHDDLGLFIEELAQGGLVKEVARQIFFHDLLVHLQDGCQYVLILFLHFLFNCLFLLRFVPLLPFCRVTHLLEGVILLFEGSRIVSGDGLFVCQHLLHPFAFEHEAFVQEIDTCKPLHWFQFLGDFGGLCYTFTHFVQHLQVLLHLFAH